MIRYCATKQAKYDSPIRSEPIRSDPIRSDLPGQYKRGQAEFVRSWNTTHDHCHQINLYGENDSQHDGERRGRGVPNVHPPGTGFPPRTTRFISRTLERRRTRFGPCSTVERELTLKE
eukprot:scaffold4927_cov139-Amphora_coffeaeformis.AAC.4